MSCTATEIQPLLNDHVISINDHFTSAVSCEEQRTDNVGKSAIQLNSDTMKEIKFKEKEDKKKISIPKGTAVLIGAELAVGLVLYLTNSESGTIFLQIAAIDTAEKVLKRMAKRTTPLVSAISVLGTVLAGYLAGWSLSRSVISWAGVKMATSASITAVVNKIILQSKDKEYQPLLDKIVGELKTEELSEFDIEDINNLVEEEILNMCDEHLAKIRKAAVKELEKHPPTSKELGKALKNSVKEAVKQNPIEFDEKKIKANTIHRLCGKLINKQGKKLFLETITKTV